MMLAPDYLQQLQALLPTGAAWPRDDDAVLTQLLAGLAEEFARLDGRVADLLVEADPDTAVELLADWERLLGLPDACVPSDPSMRARQRLVAQKLTSLGGQSRAYFIGLAAQLGFEIEIVEFEPFAAGSDAGDLLYDDAWRHAWEVRVLAAADGPAATSAQINISEFTAGSDAGDYLRTFEAKALECVISRAQPAHTALLFSYDLDPEPTLWFDFA